MGCRTHSVARLLAVAATALTAGCSPEPDTPRLTVAVWGGSREMAEFRQHVLMPVQQQTPGLRIDEIYIPADYTIKLATMMAGGTPPDIFYLADDYVPKFAALGAMLDLTDRVGADDDPAVDLDDYYPSILANYRRGGRLYGLPWIAQPVVLYCNDAMFETAGVALPDGTWRWDDFVRAGQALTIDADNDGLAEQWGFVVNGWPPIEMFVWQRGVDLIDPTGRTPTLTDPRCLEAARFYRDMIHRHRFAPPMELVTEQGFSELFRAGKVAMFMGGAADDLDSTPGLAVSVHEIPAGPDGRRATFAWNAGLHISATTADPDLAYNVWKRLLDAIQHWKVPAPRKSLAGALEQVEPRKAAAADVIRRSMVYMRPLRVIERQQQWETIMTEQFEEPLLRGSEDITVLAERTQRQLEMLMR